MRVLLLAVISLLFPEARALARGDGTFQVPLSLRDVGTPVSVTAGDFNRDNKLDLAVADGTSTVRVQIQDPLDRNRWQKVADATIGTANYFVRAADFDADGDDDLIVADPGSAAYFLRSRGDGTFDSPVALAGERTARMVAVGDFNGDGRLDAATTNDVQSFSVYLGGGDGTFEFIRSFPATNAHDIEATDFDGDGRTDLLLKTKETGTFPFRSKGDGDFEALPLVANLGVRGDISSGDFNGDGKGDLLTDYGVGISNGDGTFRRTLDLEHAFMAVAAADLSGDGRLDAAIVSVADQSSLEVYVGNGDGTFLPPVTLPMMGSYYAMLARDLDRDGHVDLITFGWELGVSIAWGREGGQLLSSVKTLSGFGSARAMALADLNLDASPDLFLLATIAEKDAKVLVYLGPGKDSPAGPPLGIPTTNEYYLLESVDLSGDGVPDLAGATLASGKALFATLDSSGHVSSESALAAGQVPSSVAVGRIDGDSTVDVAVTCQGSGHVAIFLNQGGGSFAPARNLGTVNGPRDAAIGDLDGDGFADLAVVSRTVIAVHYGAGDGSFSGPVTLKDSPGKSYTDVAAADMDGDGLADVVVSESIDSGVAVYALGASREVRSLPVPPLPAPPSTLAVADLDENGFNDITASSGNQAVFVLLNRGAQGFADPSGYPVGMVPVGHRIADLDRDGALDLVVLGERSAAILFGHPAPAPQGSFRRGDSNGDGQMNLSDAVALLNWLFLGGEALPCDDAGDSNDDGGLNLSDAIATLNRLFLGGDPLPPPGSETCGTDPTADVLSCATGC